MELTDLRITAVDSDVVLARVVVLLNARGARIRELQCRTVGTGATRIACTVETANGRGGRVAAAVARMVDVTDVEVGSARLVAPA
ncbi:hypothetical protein GCM10009547_39440 [Sporichthya brevicatena]|uniref:ACT domain-containing protein n=1 Tax=Sporichthya brevicatena TaxID=171442 RepID=A0ABP3SFJ1_9ACTN